MLGYHFVESFLRLNGLDIKAPTDVIHRVLVKAEWSETEITRAISLIKDTDPEVYTISTIGYVTDFTKTNKVGTSEDLSMLLGVDVVVDPAAVRAIGSTTAQSEALGGRIFVISSLVITSFIIAFGIAVIFYVN